VTRARRELDKWAGDEGWVLHHARTPAELEEGRRVLLALHAERWRKQGHEGVFARDRFRRFHDEVMPELLRHVDGELDLLWLTVGAREVAVVYNIIYGNKAYAYQTGRAGDVPKNLRIGIAIHAIAIERYIGRKLREYDFCSTSAR
jgi:hypothetical protein